MTGSLEPYFLNPTKHAMEESRRMVEREMDIAAEIFVAQKQVIHYSDIMSNKTVYASKAKLISWLNDNNRNKTSPRAGIVRLYKYNHSDHFQNGKWEARNLALFVQYALSCLADKSVVKNQKNANIFIDSMQNQEWFAQAVSLMSTKLLEDLYYNDALKSKVAYSLTHCALTTRILLEKTGKIVGRAGKNQNCNLPDDYRSEITNYLKEQIKVQLKIAECHEEHAIFKKYEPSLRSSIYTAKEQVFSKDILTLV